MWYPEHLSKRHIAPWQPAASPCHAPSLHLREITSASRASRVALGAKNPPAMQATEETKVRKIPRRKTWQPAPVFLPGESHGQRSLAGYSPCSQRGVRRDGSDLARKHLCFPVSGAQGLVLSFLCEVSSSLLYSLNTRPRNGFWLRPHALLCTPRGLGGVGGGEARCLLPQAPSTPRSLPDPSHQGEAGQCWGWGARGSGSPLSHRFPPRHRPPTPTSATFWPPPGGERRRME